MATQQHPVSENLRTFPRRELSLPMEISLWRRNEIQVINCLSRDISLRGAFLYTTELGFPKFRTLEVRILSLLNRTTVKSRILARAVRKTDDGVAIEFRRAHNTILFALQQLLTTA